MLPRVQLIAGPARCGKTRKLLNQYRRALEKSVALGPSGLGNCCWLAPNQAAVTELRDMLLENGNTAYLQPNLFSFASFAERVITESRRRIRPISQIQKRRLLRHVVQSASRRRELEHFAQVATTPGFVIQVGEFISELKRADVWPEEFQRRCEQLPRSDRRNRELSKLYAAYQQLLHRGDLYDAEGRFWAAREFLATTRGEQQFELVIINGFNDFTTAQYDILQLLGERSSRLLISLTIEGVGSSENREDASESLLFAKTGRTLARLNETFPQLQIECVPIPAPKERSLRLLQMQIFRERQQSRSDEPSFMGVEIVAADSELGELEAIARRIKALLLTPTVQPHEILLVSRGGESAAAAIAAVFADFGIPYASEFRPRLEAEPLVRALLSLLRLHREDWPFQTLLEVINNRMFTRFDAGNEGAISFATLPRIAVEHCVRAARLPTGKTALLEHLEYRRDIAGPIDFGETDERGVQVLGALDLLRQLEGSLSALPAEATIGKWTEALERLLTQLGTLFSSTEISSTESGRRAAVAWNLLRRGLLEIAQVEVWSQTKERPCKLVEFQELIVAVASEQPVPARHDAEGRVRILSAESARKLSAKHLFLIGLNEQAFSGAAPIEVPTTAESAQSPEAALPESPTEHVEIGALRSDAMHLFYELVTLPTESLTLSYPALDAKGQPLSPSPLLSDLERSVGEGRIPRSALTLGHIGDREATPHSVGGFRRQAVDRALAGKQQWLAGMISEPNYVSGGSSILSGIDSIAARGTRDNYGAYEGLILSDSAQAALAKRFDAKHLWSPSQLESYAACPFRFFAEHLLRLEPLSELTLSNDARRRGSLLHQVLATVHEQLGDEKLSKGASVDLESVDLVERFVAALTAAVKASPLRGIEQSLREIERREIEAWAPSYAEQEADYRSQWKHLDEPPRPALFEVRFGPETRRAAAETADQASTAVPFELDLGEERICLTGQIDRVDIGRVGGVTVFNIIDYKSGKEVKLKREKVRSGHQLQLPLYALAAEQLLLADQKAVALATGYWNIQGKGFQTQRGGSLQLRELADQTLKTTEEWTNLQPEIMTRVQQLISGIRDGQFPVYNEDEHCTRSCSLSTVCRVSQIRSLEKVWPVAEDEKIAERNYDI